MKKTTSDFFTTISLKNKRCFLLGGGPSLKNFDYSQLDNEFTIGINKTFSVYPCTVNYSMDKKFMDYISTPGITSDQQQLHQLWCQYPGHKTYITPPRILKQYENVFFIPRSKKKVLSLDVNYGIYPGNNSGFGALMLAISMGCKEIYLLGYDMGILENRATHWHKGYPQWRHEDNSKKKFQKFIKIFEEFAESIEKEGISVVNLNPTSNLTCFKKDSLSRVLTASKSDGI